MTCNKNKERLISSAEFNKLRSTKMPSKLLEKVRDLFVFQVLTGLRYADLASFDAKSIKNMKGMKVYAYSSKKSMVGITIPLCAPTLEILVKYNNKLPIINLAGYNASLKEVAQASDIDKPLSSHWVRHTGATLLLNNGVSMQIVSRICGHSSTKITEQVYAKLYDESVVDAVSNIENKL